MKTNWLGSLRIIGIAILFLALMAGIHWLGVERIRGQVEQFGVWAPLALMGLRLTSILFPAIPSTVYSILAGGLLGFWPGLMVIVAADMVACPINFWIARRWGRKAVARLVGQGFMSRVDTLSQRHLENNPFLITAFLMTGLFDFVCYAVGLTKTPWRQFLPALFLSILLSDPPVVAVGAGVMSGGRILLGLALLGVFFLALVTGWVNRNRPIVPPLPSSINPATQREQGSDSLSAPPPSLDPPQGSPKKD
ncbi:MAG: TVP38/TMEM64 family protein [Cyanophyceae cyanobacterium]